MLPVEIRFCRPEDRDALAEIEAQGQPFPWAPGVLAQDRRGEGGVFYLGAPAPKGVLCGFAVGRAERGDLLLLNLGVHLRYRRQGVGLQLLAAMDEAGRHLGCRRLRLHVRVSNEGARSFYADLGLRRLLRLPRYYEDGEDAEEWVGLLPLPLAPPDPGGASEEG